MSGIIGSKLNHRGSGRIAKLGTDGQVLTSSGPGVQANYEDAAGGGLDWQTIVTASTMTAVAGEGYWINTTSNTCTITLPSSASNGDEIMFVDYARNWGTNKIIIDSNGLKYQSDDDTFTVEYGTDGQSLHIVYSGATNGWIPTLDKTVEDVPSKGNQNGIFCYGFTGGAYHSMSNLISSVGVVGSDVSGVGTVRGHLAGTQYGGDKGIFGYGEVAGVAQVSMSNLVSNVGVVASDVSGVGTTRAYLEACSYGDDKGIFGFGNASGVASSPTGITNLVTNVGVIGSDVTAVGTAKGELASCEYGDDKGIFGFGNLGSATYTGTTNLVSNVGVVASDTTGVGTGRNSPGACGYGFDKGIFGYGYVGGASSLTNLVSNSGVVASDVTGVGTARYMVVATQYGGDKGIFGYGNGNVSMTNLVTNAGVVGTDVTGVGTGRYGLAACSYN